MALVSESMSVQVVDWMSTQSCLQRSMSGFTRFFHPGFTYSSIPPYATKNKQFEIFLSDFVEPKIPFILTQSIHVALQKSWKFD